MFARKLKVLAYLDDVTANYFARTACRTLLLVKPDAYGSMGKVRGARSARGTERLRMLAPAQILDKVYAEGTLHVGRVRMLRLSPSVARSFVSEDGAQCLPLRVRGEGDDAGVS